MSERAGTQIGAAGPQRSKNAAFHHLTVAGTTAVDSFASCARVETAANDATQKTAITVS